MSLVYAADRFITNYINPNAITEQAFNLNNTFDRSFIRTLESEKQKRYEAIPEDERPAKPGELKKEEENKIYNALLSQLPDDKIKAIRDCKQKLQGIKGQVPGIISLYNRTLLIQKLESVKEFKKGWRPKWKYRKYDEKMNFLNPVLDEGGLETKLSDYKTFKESLDSVNKKESDLLKKRISKYDIGIKDTNKMTDEQLADYCDYVFKVYNDELKKPNSKTILDNNKLLKKERKIQKKGYTKIQKLDNKHIREEEKYNSDIEKNLLPLYLSPEEFEKRKKLLKEKVLKEVKPNRAEEIGKQLKAYYGG